MWSGGRTAGRTAAAIRCTSTATTRAAAECVFSTVYRLALRFFKVNAFFQVRNPIVSTVLFIDGCM